MNRDRNIFRILLIIGVAIVATGVVIRVLFGLAGLVVVVLGVIVDIIALYFHINNLNGTIEQLRNELKQQEELQELPKTNQ